MRGTETALEAHRTAIRLVRTQAGKSRLVRDMLGVIAGEQADHVMCSRCRQVYDNGPSPCGASLMRHACDATEDERQAADLAARESIRRRR